MRLMVANQATPPLTSVATFLVREVPEVVSLGTSPGSPRLVHGNSADGGRGATGLGLTAQYREVVR